MTDRQTIMKFLQKGKLDLMRTVPGFVDAQASAADDPNPRVILTVAAEIEAPSMEFDSIPMPVEVVVRQPVVVMKKDESGHPKPVSVNKTSGDDATVARNAKSYEAWKRRHRHVKIKG